MNEFYTAALIKKYPRLYRGVLNSESCMQEGFSIGDGWYQLVDKLSEDIENLAKSILPPPDLEQWPEALQVKEKFGALRFYINCHLKTMWKEIDQMVSQAEAESTKICEKCGNSGTLRNDKWMRTLCDICEFEYQKRFTDQVI